MDNNFTCPFCGKEETLEHPNHWFDCLGGFFLNWPGCNEYVKRIAGNDAYKQQRCWAVLSYHIAHKFGLKPYNTGDDRTTIDFEKVLEENILPTPIEQINNMVLFLGEHIQFLGERLFFTPTLTCQLNAWLGAINEQNLSAVRQTSEDLGLISTFVSDGGDIIDATLLLEGWKHFKSLQERNPESKQIFMAMEFNEEAENFVNTHLKPLTKEMGFELKLLKEIINEKSLIDDKLRVEIKKSRLLICDLTHGNQGAYWEAGYAEGLGIHVLYICHKKVLNSRSKKKRPHFDVNHQEIFPWEDNESSITDFKEKLKAKIAFLTQ